MPRIDPPLNFLPHLEIYVQFRPRDLPHDRKKRYSYPLIPSSCLVALVSLLSTHQTARIFFGNKENSCNIIDSFDIEEGEAIPSQDLLLLSFGPLPPPSVEGAPDSVSRNPHGLETSPRSFREPRQTDRSRSWIVTRHPRETMMYPR